MPLTKKGEEIKAAMTKEYGEKKGEQVLYASKNKGTISGIDEMIASVDIADNMLSFGGGNPVSTPTGPGDKPFTAAARVSNTVIDHGEYAQMASRFLGRQVPVAAKDGIAGEVSSAIAHAGDDEPDKLIAEGEDEHIGFKKLEHEIAAKGNVSDPAAVAASIGRKKYGEAEMAKKSAAGRK